MNQTNSDSILTKITLILVSTLTVMSGATIAPSLPAMREYFAEVPHADYLVRLVLTLPALLIGSLLGALFAIILQPDVIREISQNDGNYAMASFRRCLHSIPSVS